MLYPEMNEDQTERFYKDETGALRHCLPGERLPTDRAEHVFSFDREMRMVIPVGAAKQAGSVGKDWGGYCRLSCRLALPHRFVTRHTGELGSGKPTEMILADAARNVMMEEMQRFARQTNGTNRNGKEQAMWNQIRERLHGRLLSEGWLLEEFRPGAFRLEGA